MPSNSGRLSLAQKRLLSAPLRRTLHVQRFRCLTCAPRSRHRRFRLDYRLKRRAASATLSRSSYPSHIAPVARASSHDRVAPSITASICSAELQALPRGAARTAQNRAARLKGIFQLDELETFEHSRKLKPVTGPSSSRRESLRDRFARRTLPARRAMTKRERAASSSRTRPRGPARQRITMSGARLSRDVGGVRRMT